MPKGLRGLRQGFRSSLGVSDIRCTLSPYHKDPDKVTPYYRRLHLGVQPETRNLLEGSWAVISRVRSKVTYTITSIRILMSLLITTHEPSSKLRTQTQDHVTSGLDSEPLTRNFLRTTQKMKKPKRNILLYKGNTGIMIFHFP